MIKFLCSLYRQKTKMYDSNHMSTSPMLLLTQIKPMGPSKSMQHSTRPTTRTTAHCPFYLCGPTSIQTNTGPKSPFLLIICTFLSKASLMTSKQTQLDMQHDFMSLSTTSASLAEQPFHHQLQVCLVSKLDPFLLQLVLSPS